MTSFNFFKEAERILSERGNLDRALENLRARQNRIIRHNAPGDLPSIDYSRPYVSSSDVNDALADCVTLAQLSREIAYTVEVIAEIDSVLSQLDETDASLLRSWYIDNKPRDEITQETGYASNQAIYNLRNAAVSRFAILYFGAGALAST